MDAAKKKALFRAKLNAQKKEKKIDSPLVRYNELDQLVCRVCDVVLKSEFHWDAHQASRKHHEAMNNIKANAARLRSVNNAKPEPPSESAGSAGSKRVNNAELPDSKPESSTELPRPQSSSVLPPDFFDNNDTKRQKTGADTVKPLDAADSYEKSAGSIQTKATESFLEDETNELPSGNHPQSKRTERTQEITTAQTKAIGSQTKQVKGALPEGFFDNKEADLRARGIKLVKPDVNDEYKEFEKLIQEDLQGVDDRLEEEEIDAAETIEEAESLEQKAYREKVELLKKKKLEVMAARSLKRSEGSGVATKEPSDEESSSDDDSDTNFSVAWRTQHL